MPPPPRLVNWFKATYQRPQFNPEWLAACYEYIVTDLGVNPNDFETLKTHVDEQFLQSSLTDSMLPDTGLPAPGSHGIRIKNTLCEVVAITEIGHSAFSLKNVRQARIDKEDLAGLAGDLDDGEDYSIPKYPRGMLRMEVSDGHKTIPAIEYRRIPDLELGVTPLGVKIYIKDAEVRRGIIFLEPKGIVIKGFQTEELEQNQDRDFLRGLRRRMRLPEEDPNEQPAAVPRPPPEPVDRPNVPVAQPVVPRPAAPRPVAAVRATGGAPQRPANRLTSAPPPPTSSKGKGPVVDLDPDDLNVDFEDSYSIGDGIGDETFEIDDAFLQELEQAEQRALMSDRDEIVLHSDEDSEPEIKPKPKHKPPPQSKPPPRPSKRVQNEDIIDISD